MKDPHPVTDPPRRTNSLKLIPWNVFSIILIGAFIGPMSGIIVSIALPTIARVYDADIQSVKWVVMIYLVTTACLLPIFGRLGRWAGEERLFTLGFAISALGTLACGVAPDDKLWLLVTFRVVHAVGSSLIFALLSSLLTKYVPAKIRGLSFGLVGATVGISLVVGIFAGTLLCQYASWRMVFLILTPIQFVAFVLCLKAFAKTSIPREQIRLPLPNVLLWVILMAGTTLVLEAYAKGFLVELVPLTAMVTAVALFTFIWIERSPSKLFSYEIFKEPAFVAGAVGLVAINFVVLVITLFIPFYLENYLGLTQSRMGSILGLVPILTLLVSPAAGRFSDKLGFRLPVLGGLALATLGFVVMALWGFNGGITYIICGLFLVGLGSGLYNSPAMSAMMGSVGESLRAQASSVSSLSRNLGFMFGTGAGAAAFTLFLSLAGGQELIHSSWSGGLSTNTVPLEMFTFTMSGLMWICGMVCAGALLANLKLPNKNAG